MNKAILMIDMPVACLTCKGLGRLKGGFLVPDKWYCRFDCMTREIDDNSSYMKFERPDWCPLIPEPERKSGENLAFYQNLFTAEDMLKALDAGAVYGWNACLDKLEGKNNE